MGLGLCWVMQFHMSWVALFPFVVMAAYYTVQRNKTGAITPSVWFALGALSVGVFVIPTYIKFGLWGPTRPATAFVTLDHWRDAGESLTIVADVVARFLSFASFAVPRFARDAITEDFAFFRPRLWLVPIALVPVISGFLQPAAMVVLWFKKEHVRKEWTAIKHLTLASVCLLAGLFLLSSRPPRSVMFNIFFPMAMIYSLYCWAPYVSRRRWQMFAGLFLACGFVLHAALGAHNRPHSWLNANRERVRTALEKKDYRILSERRQGAWY
jgi:hypothetical protein